MSGSVVERVAAALLYEGYLLYPYRRSAVKNRQRFNFGVLYPEAYSGCQAGSDPWAMQTECLAEAGPDAIVDVRVRFLHLFARTPETAGEPMWHDAIERTVAIEPVTVRELLGAGRTLDIALPPGEVPGRQVSLDGRLELAVEPVGDGAVRLRARASNRTPVVAAQVHDRDEAMLRAFVSAHTILRVDGGAFVSQVDPPAELAAATAECRNIGTWPVLVGDDGARDTMLSSPIIVSDYPTVAPESPGDFFDGTEMDEMLSLRILTLTDDEKREMAASDDRARRLLERTEACTPEDLFRMHGVLREIRALEGTR